jgi:cytochrome c oxidase subunit 2
MPVSTIFFINALINWRRGMSASSTKRFAGVGIVLSILGILGVVLSLFPSLAAADYAYNFRPPASPLARDIHHLHNLIYFICLGIFIVVFSFMFYSIYAHRKSRKHKAATFHESTTVEIIWTVIPFLILVAMAIPSTATVLKIYDTKNADLTVKITGYQWKWQYEYPEQDVSFFSTLATPSGQIENKAVKGENYLLEVDRPLVLPVGKKIRFVITANDVIHSWWVQPFGIKTDAIPGFIREAWTNIDQPGVYRGQCAELCGKDHAFMPIVVEAVTEDKFDAWIKQQQAQVKLAAADADKKWTKAELMARGEKVFAACAACHGPQGKGVPGLAPALSGSKVATGPVNGHLNIVVKGKAGTAMQAFGLQLNDLDIAAVVTFERNSLGNNTGDVIQPSQVKALR